MPKEDVQMVVDVSSFTRNFLSSMYLGVPIRVKGLSFSQCDVLRQKMANRIRIWSIRQTVVPHNNGATYKLCYDELSCILSSSLHYA